MHSLFNSAIIITVIDPVSAYLGVGHAIGRKDVMKLQTRIIILIAIGLISFSILSNWFNESNSNPVDYARITAVDYTAVVVDEPGSDGKVIVNEAGSS